ncbi:hypothetical protein CI238_06155, partial [Colletotrichum incanum]
EIRPAFPAKKLAQHHHSFTTLPLLHLQLNSPVRSHDRHIQDAFSRPRRYHVPYLPQQVRSQVQHGAQLWRLDRFPGLQVRNPCCWFRRCCRHCRPLLHLWHSQNPA